jgi:hypothetical protein
VNRDFNRTSADAPVLYETPVLDGFRIRMMGISDASLFQDGKKVLNVTLAAIRPDRVNHAILVFLYYAMAHVLAVTSGKTAGAMNNTNLGQSRLIRMRLRRDQREQKTHHCGVHLQ